MLGISEHDSKRLSSLQIFSDRGSRHIIKSRAAIAARKESNVAQYENSAYCSSSAVGMAEPPCKRPRPEAVDGVTDFEQGQRDFSPETKDSKAICADFTSHNKQYTNGVIAKLLGHQQVCCCQGVTWSVQPLRASSSPSLCHELGPIPRNAWRQARGPLTGEVIRIPDVNSGYPKGVYPTKWKDTDRRVCCSHDMQRFCEGQESRELQYCQDGDVLPESVDNFEIGDGFPDANEFVMKFGVP